MDITHTYVYYLIVIICVIAGYTKSYGQAIIPPYDYRVYMVNPKYLETPKNRYSKNLLFTIGTWVDTQTFSLNKRDTTHVPMYLLGNDPIIWDMGGEMFYIYNSTFFGVEFDNSFNHENYMVRIGDSSEKIITILVNLFY
tara:strand:+ start:912 stop:1331 length:420 start_codon:yes stop_codon:yes gene_type:complete